MKKFILILITLFSLFRIANAQYIIAGQHSLNDYYYQFTSDSIVINIPEYSMQYYSIDVNNDGIMDFQFALLAPGDALGFNSYFCTLSGLNNNEVALANYDTCFNYGGGYINRYAMAFAFNYNDFIDFTVNWINSCYLNYYYMVGAVQDSEFIGCGTPEYSGNAYLGIRVQVDSVYKYGWIKIGGTTFNPYGSTTLTIEAFACESNSVVTNNVEQIKIFPNPAKEIITIETNSNTEQRLEILNIIGQTVYTSIINSQKTTINTSAFRSGVYILKLYTDKETVVKKFIKE